MKFLRLKRILICIIISVFLLSGCGTVQRESSEPQTDKSERYENSASRGVWLSFSEINSMLASENGFKAEFDAAVRNLKALKITDIYVHVRSYCDSLFKSDYFPQIDEALDLDYDPFEYITEACHKNGIKVHAWLNPYRVLTSSEDIEKLNHDSPAYKWLNDESTENDLNVIRYNGIYLNPAEYEVRELVICGIREILNKYKVDGIHFDDYFYPTTDAEFDLASYEKYKASSENPLPLDEWRRSNVNALISGSYTAVKFFSKDILFTVSPMASVDKNYTELYADIKTWIENGCSDAIIPQLYFGYDYPDPDFKFDNLLDEWTELCAINSDVSLMIGLGTYKIGTDSEPDREEWQSDTDIIARQAKECYRNGNVSGYVLFSYTSLVSGDELNAKQRENLKEFIITCG